MLAKVKRTLKKMGRAYRAPTPLGWKIFGESVLWVLGSEGFKLLIERHYFFAVLSIVAGVIGRCLAHLPIEKKEDSKDA